MNPDLIIAGLLGALAAIFILAAGLSLAWDISKWRHNRQRDKASQEATQALAEASRDLATKAAALAVQEALTPHSNSAQPHEHIHT